MTIKLKIELIEQFIKQISILFNMNTTTSNFSTENNKKIIIEGNWAWEVRICKDENGYENGIEYVLTKQYTSFSLYFDRPYSKDNLAAKVKHHYNLTKEPTDMDEIFKCLYEYINHYSMDRPRKNRNIKKNDCNIGTHCRDKAWKTKIFGRTQKRE